MDITQVDNTLIDKLDDPVALYRGHRIHERNASYVIIEDEDKNKAANNDKLENIFYEILQYTHCIYNKLTTLDIKIIVSSFYRDWRIFYNFLQPNFENEDIFILVDKILNINNNNLLEHGVYIWSIYSVRIWLIERWYNIKFVDQKGRDILFQKDRDMYNELYQNSGDSEYDDDSQQFEEIYNTNNDYYIQTLHKDNKNSKYNLLEDLKIRLDKEKDNDNNEMPECKICFNNKINSIFNCGHMACLKCSYALCTTSKNCHLCKEVIKDVKKMFY